jgi:hypothetical protein
MVGLLQGWEDGKAARPREWQGLRARCVKALMPHRNINAQCIKRGKRLHAANFIAAHGEGVLKNAADSPFGYFPSLIPRDKLRKNIMTD